MTAQAPGTPDDGGGDDGPTAALPRPRQPLTGRTAELDGLVAILAQGPGLVTLTGAGGIGKTRVAVEVAHRLAPRLADGVAFVPLAGVTDPTDVAITIAGALRLAGASQLAPEHALAVGLRHRQLLLVLDNFEHLVAAAPLVGELLAGATGLRVLVTSQVPLAVAAEHRIELTPLDLPGPVTGPITGGAIEQLAGVTSVDLFVQRAAEVDDDFALTPGNAELVAELCRLLDGSPLAIELAAARTRLLPLAQLVERVAERPLAVLATSSRPDRPVRHRSVRAAIAWSHDLLPERERSVLHQLSVFEHQFSLEGAEAVVAGGPGEVLDALDVLVDAHLVERARPTGPPDTPRLAMPVPVRDFARQQLHAEDGYDAVHTRLVDHVVAVGARVAVALETAQEQAGLDLVEREIDEIRAVLAHLRSHDPTAGLRLAAGLGPFWLHRGFLAEGRRHLAPALGPAPVPGADPSLVAAAVAWEARLAADQGVVGDHPGAPAVLDQLQRGLARARRDGDVDAELRVLDFLSHVLVLHDNDPGRAVAVTDEGIAVARRHARPWWLAQLLQRAAVFARLDDDLTAAVPLAAEALAISRQLGAERLVLHAGLTVAQLPPDDRVPDPPDLPTLYGLATRLGDQRMRCTLVMSLGIETMLAGERDVAAARFRRSVSLSRDTGYWHAIGFSLMCTAAYAALVGDHETCARMHGATRDTIPVLRRGMPPAYFYLYQDLVAGAGGTLGSSRFERLADDAATLGWEFATDAAMAYLARHAAVSPPADPPIDEALVLTKREREVLACIAAGDTNKDVARRLSISPKTVMHHTTSIYRKLGARGRAEAVAIGQRRGLIALPVGPVGIEPTTEGL